LRAEQPHKSAILDDLARWPEQLGLTHG
jgi:hypothetical protein